MRRARLRRSGWQAVLPWKALRGVGVRVARYVLARGSDSNNYAYSTTATQRWRFTPQQISLRDCAQLLLVSYNASLDSVTDPNFLLLHV